MLRVEVGVQRQAVEGAEGVEAAPLLTLGGVEVEEDKAPGRRALGEVGEVEEEVEGQSHPAEEVEVEEEEDRQSHSAEEVEEEG